MSITQKTKYEMRYLDIISEAVVPETSYGYWISPMGEYLAVGFQRHRDVILAHQPDIGGIDQAIRQGWIRIAIYDHEELSIELRSSQVSIKARIALQRVMLMDDYERFYVEDTDHRGKDKKFNRAGEVMAYLIQSKLPTK